MMKDRNTLFPIIFKEIFDCYQEQVKSIWTPYEIPFEKDLNDLKKMSKEERHLILQILAFFAQSDSIVNENLCFRFMKDINIPEAIQAYQFQVGMEAIHSHTYANMIDNYVQDSEEKNKLFNAIQNFPTIAKKAAWMKKWIDSQASFSKRMFAFAIVEGVFFSGSFCTIYWLKDRGLLPGLSMANDLIARDEASHQRLASIIYKTLKNVDGQNKSKQFYLNSRLMELTNEEIGKVTKEIHMNKKLLNADFIPLKADEVKEIILEAVAIEKDFIKNAIPVKLLGINEDLLCQYIEYVADIVTNSFGFENIYNTKQPFDFMIKNDIRGKVNFFEGRPTEYQKGIREEVNFDKINDTF